MDTKIVRPKVNDIETNKDLAPFINGLLLGEPFFGHIFRHVNFTADPKMPTAGVAVHEGDLHMYWSPEFMSSLTNKQVFGLLKHEAFHLIFQHCTKRRLEPHGVANIAADLAINCGVPEEELPAGAFIPGKLHVNPDGSNDGSATAKLIATFPPDQSQEWYFTKLMERDEVKKELAPSGGEPTLVQGFDDHEGWGEMSPEEAELVKGKIGQILKDAISKADKVNGWGSISANMREKLRELVSNEVDWRAVLRQFVKASRRGQSTSTWTNLHMSNLHPDRGPASPGKKRGYTSNINVYFDQSGSMNKSWVELLFAELKNFAARTEFDCYVFDTEVNEKSKIKYRGRRTPELHGVRRLCGGTCFKAPTKHANSKKNLDAMIILTDGGAEKPQKSRIKRCYVLAPGQKLSFKPDPEDYIVYMKPPARSD
jgi:predicted metal-dependent peptidase